MSPHDPFEQHRAAFGAELVRATPRARRRRRQRILALGGATVALAGAATAVAITLPTTGSTLDVVGDARAAIAVDSAAIIHFAVVHDAGYPVPPAEAERAKACASDPVKVWRSTAAGPLRYRIRQPIPKCFVNEVGSRLATGHLETAYADRTLRTYAPDDGFMTVETGLPEEYDHDLPIVSPFGYRPLGQDDPVDPVARIRSLLTGGALTDAGELQGRDGRRLRRLVGSYSEKRGDPAAPKTYPVSVDYRVDAKTYAPVLISTTHTVTLPRDLDDPKRGMVARPVTDRVRFSAYDKLPLTRANEGLLTVQPAPGTDVTTERWSRNAKPTRPSREERARAKKAVRAQILAGTRVR